MIVRIALRAFLPRTFAKSPFNSWSFSPTVVAARVVLSQVMNTSSSFTSALTSTLCGPAARTALTKGSCKRASNCDVRQQLRALAKDRTVFSRKADTERPAGAAGEQLGGDGVQSAGARTGHGERGDLVREGSAREL